MPDAPDPPVPPSLQARLRALPQVQRVLEEPALEALRDRFGPREIAGAARVAVEEARWRLRAEGDAAAPAPEALAADAVARLQRTAEPGLKGVINATGVILHTNLGRAPLAAPALEAVRATAGGYSDLEFDLGSGRRGSRTAGVEPLIREMTGAQAALAVNNAAAAVLLAMSALAGPGAEVIVSRGELVEIGGGFRIPDVIVQGGARLVEVGTTNKTRLADYADAVTPQTRMILKVHQSNYRMVGFTGEVGLEALARLARDNGLALMHDLGGGALLDLRRFGLPGEPTARDSLQTGADLVIFSGDKLMGGPQAGLIAGRAQALAPLRRHPLLRAVRMDKMSLAALEATLALYRDEARAVREVPALRMLAEPLPRLEARATRLLAALPPGLGGEVVASEAFTGGGTLPGHPIPSRAVALRPASPDALAAALRTGRPPVVARVAQGRLLLDLRTVAEEELEPLARALAAAAAAPP